MRADSISYNGLPETVAGVKSHHNLLSVLYF